MPVAPFDNTKFDVELNNVPYRVRAITKSEVNPFIPRLGSGDQKESEFDLLRSKTLDGFEGGILQREWIEDNSIFGSEGVFPFFDDGVLYPTNSPAQITGSRNIAPSAVSTSEYFFQAFRSYSPGVNSITRTDVSGAVITLTLPSSLANWTSPITSMVIWNNQLWIAADGSSVWYMPLTVSTVIEVTSGGGGFCQQIVYRGSLYGTNGGGMLNNELFRYTGDTTTRSFASVGKPNATIYSPNTRLLVMAGRIYYTRPEGLYSYDAVNFTTVDDSLSSPSFDNYSNAVTLKGYLYYFMPDGFYRFNGVLIEKLYDAAEIGLPADVCVGGNKLWLYYANSTPSTSNRYNRAMGYDNAVGNGSGDSGEGFVLSFTGKSLYGYARTVGTPNRGVVDFAGQNAPNTCYWFNDKLYLYRLYDHEGYYDTVTTARPTSNKTWKILTSIFDGGFSMVDKSLDNVAITLDGSPSSWGATVEYRTTGFEGSAGWATLGTFSSNSFDGLRIQAVKSVPAGVSFRRIQFRISGTTPFDVGIAKFTARFILSPDFKWQWTLTVPAYGSDINAPLLLRDGSQGTQNVKLLRGNIYAARNSAVPVLFCDVDEFSLSGALTTSTAIFGLVNYELLPPQGYLKVDSEIISFVLTGSSVISLQRGALGTTAAAHSAAAKVFVLYRVVVRQISQERIELPEQITDPNTAALPSEFVISLQQV